MKMEYVNPKMDITWMGDESAIYTFNSDIDTDNPTDFDVSGLFGGRFSLRSLSSRLLDVDEEEETTETETEVETQTEFSNDKLIEDMISTKGEQWSQASTETELSTEPETIIEKVTESITDSFIHSWFGNDSSSGEIISDNSGSEESSSELSSYDWSDEYTTSSGEESSDSSEPSSYDFDSDNAYTGNLDATYDFE